VLRPGDPGRRRACLGQPDLGAHKGPGGREMRYRGNTILTLTKLDRDWLRNCFPTLSRCRWRLLALIVVPLFWGVSILSRLGNCGVGAAIAAEREQVYLTRAAQAAAASDRAGTSHYRLLARNQRHRKWGFRLALIVPWMSIPPIVEPSPRP